MKEKIKIELYRYNNWLLERNPILLRDKLGDDLNDYFMKIECKHNWVEHSINSVWLYSECTKCGKTK